MKRSSGVLLLLAVLALTSCGSESTEAQDSGKAPESSSTPSPTNPEPSSDPVPSGTVATKPLRCKKLSAPSGFKPADVPPQANACAFENADARVGVSVNAALFANFEQNQRFEELQAKENGVTPPVLEEVTLDGWTYAVIWPEIEGFNRMDRFLLDSAGQALKCSVGVQGGKVDETTHAEVCESARSLLFTP